MNEYLNFLVKYLIFLAILVNLFIRQLFMIIDMNIYLKVYFIQ